MSFDPHGGHDCEPWCVHGVKPWTVLRQDHRRWRQRKRWWLDHGLDDRGGRPDARIYRAGPHTEVSGGGSTFDPVLAEVCVRWYSPPAGRVLDPFAGGPTRGVVAAALGRHYRGVDLLWSQVEHDRGVWGAWEPRCEGTAVWEHGDSLQLLPSWVGCYDYAFSCPPYWRLERYSDDPRDLSVMSLEGFLQAHGSIIGQVARLLHGDSFATWVVGDVRDNDGYLCGLPSHTISAFAAVGMRLVNDQVLSTPIGSRFWTLGRHWQSTRSATRLHQYVLTFVKGDRRRATARVEGTLS